MQATQFMQADFPQPYFTAPLIAQESSFDFNSIHLNKNGTHDAGPCQINDVHGYTIEQRQGYRGLQICASMLRKGEWFHSHNNAHTLLHKKAIALRMVKAAYSSNYSYTRIYSSTSQVVKIVRIFRSREQKLQTLESVQSQSLLNPHRAWYGTCK